MPRPRVLISTDIGGMDNDDAQSLIHALLYANDMNYVGIVNTRTDDGGRALQKPTDGVKLINEIIDAYERDLPNLRAADRDYPTADALRDVVRMGAVDGAFPGRLSDGAKLIVSEARKASPADPLYVLTWGPIHDAAAALLSAPDIVPNVRLFSIAAWAQDKRNTTALDALERAIRRDDDYNDLWWIDSESAHRGFYMREGGMTYGVNQLLPWVLENARGAGSLGKLLVDKYTYDVHTWQDSKSSPDGLKMGDSSSLLYLLDAVNNDNPGLASWGGSFVRSGLGSQTWVDKTGPGLEVAAAPGAQTVARWRGDFLADYAERFDWAKGDGRPQPPVSRPDPKPDPKPDPDPDPDPGGGAWVGPDAKGDLRFGGKQIDGPTTTEVRGLDFGDGHRLIFTNYDPGTFRETPGGNRMIVTSDGKYVAMDSVADLVELVAASPRISARIEQEGEALVLRVGKSGGDHEVELRGLGAAYARAGGQGDVGGAAPGAGGRPGAGVGDVDRWVAPNAQGDVRIGAKQLDGPAMFGVSGLDFGDGDRLIFTNYEPGTFKATPGGNRMIVTSDGKFVAMDSVADLGELVAASPRVSARIDSAADVLILEIDRPGGDDHQVALEGYGRAYAEAFDL